MGKHLMRLSFIFLSISTNTLFAMQTPVILCSGTDNAGGRVNMEITKLWHHLEPGMEPETRYEISYAFIQEDERRDSGNSRPNLKGSVFFDEQEMMNAQSSGQLILQEEKSHVNYFFKLNLNLKSKKASITYINGKPTPWHMNLECTGTYN